MSERTREPEPYREAHLREALAADPRVAEVGLEIHVEDGTVSISGAVLTRERHDAILEVVREQVPDLAVEDHVTIEPSRDAGEPEVVG